MAGQATEPSAICRLDCGTIFDTGIADAMNIPYNRPYLTGDELSNIGEALAAGHLAGDGAFTKRCSQWLKANTGSRSVLLTHSCTAALEMCAMLCDLAPGDEVIMPSFTFVSSANAVVLRGAVPVFVDIRPDTLNIDERRIEEAITPQTRAIMVVHYAGVGCEMDTIMDIANRHGLIVIEDAAQGLLSTYKGQPLGSIGHLGCLSFHETKNIVSGEGGALLVNDSRFSDRAEIIREKGTNRSQFFRGHVDKYTWVDVGSSYLPAEMIAAFLWAQLQAAESITARRVEIWESYHAAFAGAEATGAVRRPGISAGSVHNGHIYYLLLPTLDARTAFISQLKSDGIQTVFHYVPLHSSPTGQTAGRVSGSMAVTDDLSERLVRLPLWLGVEGFQEEVITRVLGAILPPEIVSASQAKLTVAV